MDKCMTFIINVLDRIGCQALFDSFNRRHSDIIGNLVLPDCIGNYTAFGGINRQIIECMALIRFSGKLPILYGTVIAMQVDINIPACIGMACIIPGLADFNFRRVPVIGEAESVRHAVIGEGFHIIAVQGFIDLVDDFLFLTGFELVFRHAVDDDRPGVPCHANCPGHRCTVENAAEGISRCVIAQIRDAVKVVIDVEHQVPQQCFRIAAGFIPRVIPGLGDGERPLLRVMGVGPHVSGCHCSGPDTRVSGNARVIARFFQYRILNFDPLAFNILIFKQPGEFTFPDIVIFRSAIRCQLKRLAGNFHAVRGKLEYNFIRTDTIPVIIILPDLGYRYLDLFRCVSIRDLKILIIHIAVIILIFCLFILRHCREI